MSLPIADIAENFINAEADDLYAIAQGYVTAMKSGRMGNRKIAPGQAKQFAGEFRQRADALYMIAPLLKAHLSSCESPLTQLEQAA